MIRLVNLTDDLLQDLRHALRTSVRTPGFAAAVIVTLALGIGANTAMFGVVDRLMFRPYPFLRDPATVHRVYLQVWNRGSERTFWDAEYTRYLDLRRWTTSFSEVAGFTDRRLAVGEGAATRERHVAIVSASFFGFFDARPALGRFFAAAEDRTPRGAEVVVLGYGFWQSVFGGRDVRGEMLRVGNLRATIIGVAPRGFVGVDDAAPPAAYIPITTFAGMQPAQAAATYFTTYSWRWMEIMVRRKPGVSLTQASDDATRATRLSWEARRALEPDLPPAEVAKPRALVGPLRLDAGPARSLEARTALWVSGVAVIVLLIACANVANLLLARILRRRRELAMRLALGAGRGRLLRQSLTESLVLSLLGGVAGLLVATLGGVALRNTLLPGSEGAAGLPTDWRTLGIAASCTIGAGLLTGLVPWLFLGLTDLASALRAGVRDGAYRGSRARLTLLATQIALSVVLLVGASLFVRSLVHARDLRLGYDPDRVLFAASHLRGTALDSSARVELGRTLLARAKAIPGVESASWVMTVPLWRTNSTGLYTPGSDSVSRLGNFTYQAASADYFRVMGTRILRGRGFMPQDRAGAPRVAVVSEGMAHVLWPNADPIGRCIRVFAPNRPCTTVVGVAEDIVQRDLTSTERFHYYLPIEQNWPDGGIGLLIRMGGDAAGRGPAVRRALQGAMPGESYVTVQPLSVLTRTARRSWRLGATMFVAFGVLALVVALVGLYGVIDFHVTQRFHEMGVRAALGAQSADLLRLVLRQGVGFILPGVTVGVVAALGAGRWLQPLLFRESARDPGVYGLVGLALLVVAFLGSVAPALRAARADPNRVLRAE